VNVHPAKTEVRFRDPALVRGMIVSGLRHAHGGGRASAACSATGGGARWRQLAGRNRCRTAQGEIFAAPSRGLSGQLCASAGFWRTGRIAIKLCRSGRHSARRSGARGWRPRRTFDRSGPPSHSPSAGRCARAGGGKTYIVAEAEDGLDHRRSARRARAAGAGADAGALDRAGQRGERRRCWCPKSSNWRNPPATGWRRARPNLPTSAWSSNASARPRCWSARCPAMLGTRAMSGPCPRSGRRSGRL
jgi:hypothetical protein